MKFEKMYTVGAREMGLNNQLTNYGYLAFLEDIASTHSNSIGYGVKDIGAKGKAWLLMDWDLEVFGRPSFGENVLIKTNATIIQKATFSVYRNFEVYNENNVLIAKANSKWVLYDMNINKISKITTEVIALYNPEGEAITIEKLKEPESYESCFEYKVRRSDIDINKHMHNLDYLNLAYEALPEEIYNNKIFNKVRIMYKHQIKLGDTVKCFYHNENDKCIVTVKSEDGEIVHSIIEMT